MTSTATTSENKASVRLDSLTGVRAIAAALVFWHHADGLYAGDFSSGMVGVSLFYLLSGFVMAWVDRDDDTTERFYRRRFARIYPAYFVAVTIALAYAAYARGVSGADLFAYSLLQSWVPNEAVYFGASAVFWSLSCEAFFYLAFPVIRRFTRAVSTRGLWTLAAAAVATSLAIGAVGSLFEESARLQWAVVVFPPSRLPEFVIGVCLGALMARGWRPAVSLPLAWAMAAAAVVAAIFVPYSLSRYAVTLVPFALLIVALASADLGGRRTFTQARWMVHLGYWSYCFYLIHLVVIMVAVSANDHVGLPMSVIVALALAGSVVAAWLLHIVVEKPMEARLRPRGRRRADTD